MNTTPWISRTSLILAVGLLLLGGVFSDTRPARAQAQEACPISAGVTPPPDPSVTAQQVEDGSASLMAFSLAARDQLSRGVASVEEAFLIGCLLRQEGSAWRSGSTYLVQLAPNRIFFHAKAMALSGRQLNPLIYVAVLQALGINPADLLDPATALPAFAAAAAGDGGAFNMPGIPGASGYATVYISPNFPIPLILLAGFEVDESHLAAEDIDYGDPAVTARDVVDHETLKAFVTEAGAYFLEHQTSGVLDDSAKARIALRDPNGPWRHGSVYLYVLDVQNNIVLLHAARPDLLELNPLIGTARDGRTGELILPRVLAAATSGPEGGFVQYYYDDPADDTDSDDTPKVGYARQFTGDLPTADGRVLPVNFIVGSGFYLTADGEYAQRLLDALDEGQTSMLFGITTPADGDAVAGDAVAVSTTGASGDTVHFAYRPSGLPQKALTYVGAAANRAGLAWFGWNTLDVPDGDYELVALYTEDRGNSVVYDTIAVRVGNDAAAEGLDIVEDDGGKTQALRADVLNEVVTAAGAVVTLPSGALAGDDRIMIAAAGAPHPATAPGDAIGTGIDIALASGQGMFHAAATVSLPYYEGLLHERDMAEAGLSMWFFDAETEAWALLPGSMVQPDADRVVADTTQTGQYGIFNVAPLLRVEQDGEVVTRLHFGADTAMLSFTVVNGNDIAEPLTWAIASPEPAWLSISQAGDRVRVSVDRAGLGSGDYTGMLSVTSNGGDWPVTVSMRVRGGGGGGCAVLPVLPGGSPDPTLPALVGLLMVYLVFGRRRPMRQAALG